ncbi:MAG TPA: hypothetical protein VM536_19760 [Chloroflexia bacterium]|nr:hypothetical protein [Chloroflexia bacterium]
MAFTGPGSRSGAHNQPGGDPARRDPVNPDAPVPPSMDPAAGDPAGGAPAYGAADYQPPPEAVASYLATYSPDTATAYRASSAAAAPRAVRSGRGIGLGLATLLVGCSVLGGIAWLMNSGALSRATPTRVAVVPTRRPPTARPTSEAPVIGPATAVAAAATVTAAAGAATRVFGPALGDLDHRSNNLVRTRDANVRVQDLIVEATFTNPYEAGGYGWDYGFFIRDTGINRAFRVYVTSEGDWTLRYVDVPDSENSGPATATALPAGVFKTLVGGSLTNLNTQATGSNRLRLVALGDSGFFYVNDRLIATLDLSRKVESGDVLAGTAFRSNNNNPGEITRYADFSVWSLDK